MGTDRIRTWRHGAANAQSASARPRDARKIAAVAVTVAVGLGVAACGGSSEDGGSSGGGSVDVVAYSTPQELYEDSIIPAFQETPEGEGVEFSASFGSSGDQSRAVESGLPADFVHLSLEPDMQRLVDAGIVADDWTETDTDGQVQESVVVFITRPGNPKDITEWDDLVRDDVDVLTPNPFTSGGARWNIMAAYGQAVNSGASDEEALEFVQQLLENTVVQDASARDSLQTFLGGQGDVLIGYENEAIAAQNAGEEVEYTIPDDTILIEPPATVPDEAEESQEADAFLDFLVSEEGQRLFAEGGYRPVDEKVLAEFEQDFPTPSGLFTIEDFGGWEKVAVDFFDPESGSVAEIERELGVATE